MSAAPARRAAKAARVPRAPRTPHAAGYRLRLYVTGMTSRSMEAMANIRRICDQHLQGRHELEIVDLYQNALRARSDGVFAVPTLIKLSPAPVRRFIGDLSDCARVMAGLDLPFLPGVTDDSNRIAPPAGT